ncbi:hypothetical protein Tco_0751726 [Tanacetum coccineum]|uniref:Uncharacterized protein n=1 Tax=Tanacetum coccineum TaxID=301880 RepID=A0ABQ4Z507_9ASTR
MLQSLTKRPRGIREVHEDGEVPHKTDYALWQVIMNGDEPVQTTKDENGVETEVPPKTAQALLQRQRERKAKSILLLAIPDEYQLRFHGIKDAKSLWATIKSRFSGNVESKKMQKNVLKQQFKNFYVSDTEGLDKAYDRFQKLISLLEVHGAAVSNEDANQKFLRALPSSWNNVALIMRNKTGIDDLDIDDLYNNLKVFEADIKKAILLGNVEHQEIKGIGMEMQGSDTEVQSYSKNYVKTYEKLQKTVLIKQRQTLSKANLEIIAYQLGLESVEAQLVVHQKNEVVYEEKIAVLEFEVKDKVETSNTPPSNTSVEIPRVEFVKPSRVIIEDWVSDDDEDIFQSNDVQITVKPSLKMSLPKAGMKSVKFYKQAIKTRIHLIKDCDFHEKRMSKKSVLNDKGKGTGHREVRPIWNNTQRINHQNKFVPTAVLTRSGRIPVSTASEQSLIADYHDIYGGFVAIGGTTRGGKISGIGKIRTNKIDFEDVFFVKELKLIDESQVLLRVLRQNNMYSFDLKNVVPSRDLTYLFAKAIIDESKL